LQVENIQSFEDTINTFDNVLFVSERLYASDSTIQWAANEILFQIKDTCNVFMVLNELNIPYDTVKRWGYNQYSYLLTLSNNQDAVDYANLLYESNKFVYAQPSFYRILKKQNPYYPQQWNLNNTGQNGGTSGIDIDMLAAWDITTGGDAIKIAVIDDGVDLTHPDLSANLLPGYDATNAFFGGANGNCCGHDAHGTGCASIIVADDNSLGIKGIAHNSKVIPIRMGYGNQYFYVFETYDAWIVDAIDYAWSVAEADILSCSWGGGASCLAMDIAIINALTYGRGSLGCVVVFVSGNDNDIVIYPANSNDSLIVVGAMSPCGERKRSSSNFWEVEDNVTPDPQGVSCDNDTYWGSNYGPELDIVAPGIFIPIADKQGSKGYNAASGINGDYFMSFNGTSSACPHVAGVAALVLSVNSSLKSMEVKAIIESTAEKVREDLYTYMSNLYNHRNGSWSIEVGYGLVNAHRAVLNAFYHHIVGDDEINICDIKEYILNNNSYTPSNATLLWTTSSNVEIINGQGSSNLEIKGIEIGNGWIECTINHMGETVILHKDVSVNSFYQIYNEFNTGSSMTISNDIAIDGSFTIHPGHTVTINNNATVYCTPTARIIVKCGGKLIVNGAKLTSICENGLWYGIEVQGNPHLPQDINNTNQGIVILENEAIIENAHCGIIAGYKITLPIYFLGLSTPITISLYGGGIIVANNAHFKNNLRAVSMYSYKHKENFMYYGNISYFSNCTFEVDNNINFTFQVYLEDVQGVVFNGCRFTNSNEGEGIGIYVNNAGVLVNPCIPGASSIPPYYPQKCIFEGYHTAIYMQNTGSKRIKIMNAEFSNNCIAIKAVGSNALGIESCVFNVHANNCLSYYGVVLDNCNQYFVQNNRFYGNDGIGLFIFGNVENNNSIKYNDFTNLCIACNVNGRHGNGYENENITGLQFLCNRYESNYTDIKVDENGSIRYFQGDNIRAAGNEFYVQPVPPYMTTNIQNLGEHFIYFYNQNNPFQFPLNYTNVSVVQTNADACMGYGHLGLFYYINSPIFYLSELENSFLMCETQYNQALIEYENNYEGLSIEWPECCGEAFFSQPQVKDFMYLNYLKDSMDMICTHAVNLLFSMEEMDKNQYHVWLSRSNTLYNSYVLAESYLSDGNIPEMEMILNSIPTDYPACDMNEYRDYLVCSRYLSSWRSVDPEILTISNEAIDSLENIAASAPNLATVYAKSILESLGKEITYTEMPNICDCIPGYVAEQHENNTPIQNRLLTKPDIILHPNPADDKVEIEVINSSFGIRKLMIYDVYGKTVWRKNMEEKDLLLLDINELSKGLYFIYCELENTQTIIKKLIKN
jgi:subtilisin family serine protease